MPQGNLVEVLGREVRQGSPGELMVESSPSRQRRPPCKTNKEMSDEAADAAALTYLLTYLLQQAVDDQHRQGTDFEQSMNAGMAALNWLRTPQPVGLAPKGSFLE